MILDKKKAISILVLLAVVAAAVTAFVMWPKRYTVGQRMAQTEKQLMAIECRL